MGNTHNVHGTRTLKILIDESRVASTDEARGYPASTDWRHSFENSKEDWGFGRAARRLEDIGTINIRKSGELSYSILKNYDVLIIASLEHSYDDSERKAIRQFLENGGGLLFLAEFTAPNSSISKEFDVFFADLEIISDESAKRFQNTDFQFYINDIVGYPITIDVKQIALNGGIRLTSYKSGEVLARTSASSWSDTMSGRIGKEDPEEEEGPFDILLAMDNIGKGRAVFFGSSSSFYNWVITMPRHQNLDLLENAVNWLGEPGGPYKQYKSLNDQAQQKISDAKSLYEDHKFSQAKTRFEEAIEDFEKSNEIYPNSQAIAGIDEAKAYISECTKGIEANQTFENALDLLNNQEYEEAVEKFEKAKSLYQCNDEISRIKKNRILVMAGVTAAVVAVLVLGVVLLHKRKAKKIQPEVLPESPRKVSSSLEIVAIRYAKGEITKEEYEEIRSVLEKS